MNRTQQDVRTALDTVLSGASQDPALFNRVVNASKGDAPKVKRKLTASMAFVLILVLMSGTVALAAAYRGVSWFLTERTAEPLTIDPDLLMSNLTQESTSEWLDAHVQDAYWDGTLLSVSIYVTAKDAAYPFAMEYDIGADGESFDRIWLSDAEGNPNQMALTDWLNGRTAILLRDPEITVTAADESAQWTSLDYVHELEENAIVMLLQIPVNDLSQGGRAVIKLDSVKLYPDDDENAPTERWLAQEPGETESAVLTVTLPAVSDPVAAHTHDWTAATCTSRSTCTICGRTTGDLGEHDFQPGPEAGQYTCSVCKCSYFVDTQHETLRPGDEGDAVADLQTRLQALNLYDGEISGVYDDQTIQAVKRFQKENGLTPDGVCGTMTLELLNK